MPWHTSIGAIMPCSQVYGGPPITDSDSRPHLCGIPPLPARPHLRGPGCRHSQCAGGALGPRRLRAGCAGTRLGRRLVTGGVAAHLPAPPITRCLTWEQRSRGTGSAPWCSLLRSVGGRQPRARVSPGVFVCWGHTRRAGGEGGLGALRPDPPIRAKSMRPLPTLGSGVTPPVK